MAGLSQGVLVYVQGCKCAHHMHAAVHPSHFCKTLTVATLARLINLGHWLHVFTTIAPTPKLGPHQMAGRRQ